MSAAAFGSSIFSGVLLGVVTALMFVISAFVLGGQLYYPMLPMYLIDAGLSAVCVAALGINAAILGKKYKKNKNNYKDIEKREEALLNAYLEKTGKISLDEIKLDDLSPDDIAKINEEILEANTQATENSDIGSNVVDDKKGERKEKSTKQKKKRINAVDLLEETRKKIESDVNNRLATENSNVESKLENNNKSERKEMREEKKEKRTNVADVLEKERIRIESEANQSQETEEKNV